jgi:hypothetical protein
MIGALVRPGASTFENKAREVGASTLPNLPSFGTFSSCSIRANFETSIDKKPSYLFNIFLSKSVSTSANVDLNSVFSESFHQPPDGR